MNAPNPRFTTENANDELEASELRATYEIAVDGYSHVQVVLTHEGVIIDAFNEEGDCYRTQAFTYEEFAMAGEPR